MRISPKPSYQPGLAVLAAAALLAGAASCASSNFRLRAARSATYQAAPATIYKHAVATVSSMYPIEKGSDPADRVISTQWQPVKSTGPTPGQVHEFDPEKDSRSRQAGVLAGNSGQNRARYIRFKIAVVGDSPWQVRVIGQASATAPSASSRPTFLRRSEYPTWFRSRIDDVQLAIHQDLKAYAVEFDSAPRSSSEPPSGTAQAASTHASSTAKGNWPATVHVRGTSSGILVSTFTERLETEEGERGSSPSFYWKKVCTAPCSFRLMPGLQNLRVESRDGSARERLELEPGSSTYLFVKPGSERLSLIASGVALAGIAGILVGSGAMLWEGIEPWSLWTVGGGFGGFAVGIGMGVASLPSIAEESAPKPTPTRKAISFSGSF